MLREKAANERHYRRPHGDLHGRCFYQRSPPHFEKLDGFASQAHINLVGRARQRVNVLSVTWVRHRQFAGAPLMQPSRDALTKAL